VTGLGVAGSANFYVKTEFRSIANANGDLVWTAISDFEYDKNGNLTSEKVYDWVSYASAHSGGPIIPAGAVPARVTVSSYNNATPAATDSSSDSSNAYWYASAPTLRSAMASMEIRDGNGGKFSRYEFSYDNAATTGNVTQQTHWDSSRGAYSNPLMTGNSVTLSTQYNQFGQPTLTTDARGYQTQLTYGSVGGFTQLYPTEIRTALVTTIQRTAMREYDFSSGLVTRVTDADNNVSTSTAYDAVGRPLLVRSAEGTADETRTVMVYSDAERRVITRADLGTIGDGKLVSIQHYDQLGRARLSRKLEDPATQSETDESAGIKVQTRYSYSGLNSYQVASHPYREAASSQVLATAMDWTRSKSDNAGRLVEVKKFGGTNLPAPWGNNNGTDVGLTNSYDANFTTITDQAGKKRRSMTDALGELIRVDEPDPATGALGTTDSPTQPTSYAYDPMGNLRSVTQGNQHRFFYYDSLSRLLRAYSPEQAVNSSIPSLTDPVSGNNQWSMACSYDENGNLKTRIDSRNITTTYGYDALNRVTGIIYTNDPASTPATSRYYDGLRDGVNYNIPNSKGKLWQTETSGDSGSRTTIDSFDALGRPLAQRQQFNSYGTWSQSFPVARSYDRAGNVIALTYPSGHTVNYSYDSANRTSSFTGNLGEGVPRNYATDFQYNEWGGIQQEKFGTDTPLYHKQRFNERGQLWDMRLSTVPYNTDPVNGDRGAVVNYYSNSYEQGGTGSDNNGNLLRQEIVVPSGGFYQQNYDYDYLNRLTSVSEKVNGTGSNTFKQAYTYDRWGNRTINQSLTTDNVPHPAYTVDTLNNNRLKSPVGFDPLAYDDAGNLTQDSTSQNSTAISTYDAENRLASIEFPTVPVCFPDGEGGEICYPGTGQAPITYIYDGEGRRVRRAYGGWTAFETWQVYGFEESCWLSIHSMESRL